MRSGWAGEAAGAAAPGGGDGDGLAGDPGRGAWDRRIRCGGDVRCAAWADRAGGRGRGRAPVAIAAIEAMREQRLGLEGQARAAVRRWAVLERGYDQAERGSDREAVRKAAATWRHSPKS